MDDQNRQKELAKNTLILTIGRVCTQGISFFLLPLYTALLAPDEYGIVDLFNTYITLLTPFVSWEYDLGVFRFMLDHRGDEKRQGEIISSVLLMHGGQCLIYIVIFAIVQPFISSEYKIFLAIDVVVNVFLNTMLQFARGLGHNGSYSLASLLSGGLTVVLNVLFIVGFGWGAWGLFTATVLAKIISLCYLLLSQRIWRYFGLSHFNKERLKQIHRYSFPMIAGQLSWWVLNASDRTIVSKALGVAANGIYSVAYKFSSLYITFYNIFNMAWTESVTLHFKDEDRDEFFSQLFQTVFSLFAAASLGMISLMPWVYPLMINEQYSDGYGQVPILLIAALLQVVCGLYSVIYLAVKKSGESAKTSLFAAVINIVVDIALIKFIGLYAASISTLVAFGAMTIYRYFDSKKYINMKISPALLVSTLVVAVIDLVFVEYNHTITNVINFVIVVAYAIIVNLPLIKSLLSELRLRYHK